MRLLQPGLACGPMRTIPPRSAPCTMPGGGLGPAREPGGALPRRAGMLPEGRRAPEGPRREPPRPAPDQSAAPQLRALISKVLTKPVHPKPSSMPPNAMYCHELSEVFAWKSFTGRPASLACSTWSRRAGPERRGAAARHRCTHLGGIVFRSRKTAAASTVAALATVAAVTLAAGPAQAADPYSAFVFST